MEEERKSFALLIDSDNVSAKYIQGIMNELTSRHGQVTYRRIYGDWTSTQMGKWKDVLAEYSLTPMQQFANTKGKNATDSFLIIDAMDILYEGKVDGFCIVSSDSDFTRLASRLRDAGMTVVGMGEKKTPRSFRSACTVFTSLELVIEADETEESVAPSPQQDEGTSQRDVADAITGIINDAGGDVSASELGSRLVRIYPDFDVRSFGYSQLSKFLESFPNLRVDRRENSVLVSLRDTDALLQNVVAFMRELVRSRSRDGVALGVLGGKIHDEFPDFNMKDFGYSKLSKFARDVDGVMMEQVDGVTRVFPEYE
ncbi:NYN domain-containing protein [Curtanaerobium respiraculi]|uniref:NYN domain-containing protein n=1 Tax=Curtanaerobium respiraculi TaxID=2949669 RepID=UPI0024B3BB99|nr:NYN domain-containing protein [Curtanaerobium respiraculi]